MPTRAQVQTLLEQGHNYETAGPALGISAAQAFMIATGRPADSSNGEPPAQDLFVPPPFNPTSKAHVLDWVRERAAQDLT